jgi:HAD superfamily hydrolase (TIGR01450 family)
MTSSSTTNDWNSKPRLSEEDRKRIWDQYDNFLFDCDGVIWRGDDPISGASELLTQLRLRGKRVIFVSNNSTTTRSSYVKKFIKHGLEAKEEEIFSSAFAAGAYLSTLDGFRPEDQENKKVLILFLPTSASLPSLPLPSSST